MNDINISGNTKACIDILGNKWTYECLGCSISNKSMTPPGGIIYDGRHFILAADTEVPIPGFLIITCKKHVKSISELTEEERIEMINILFDAEKVLKDLYHFDELTVIQEERSSHLHIWILPTHKWMIEKYKSGVTYIKDIFKYAQENSNQKTIKEVLRTVDEVREYFDKRYI